MTILRSPDQLPLALPETLDDLIRRHCAGIEAEIKEMAERAHEFVAQRFYEVTKHANRSIAQRKRFLRERISNHGSINRRKKCQPDTQPQ